MGHLEAIYETNQALVEDYIRFKSLKKQYSSIIRQFGREANRAFKECDSLDIKILRASQTG